jgi:hypothetical protein
MNDNESRKATHTETFLRLQDGEKVLGFNCSADIAETDIAGWGV